MSLLFALTYVKEWTSNLVKLLFKICFPFLQKLSFTDCSEN